MANATYILGTNEYVVVELTRTALSATFTPANWEYELCLVGIGEDFDETAATWVDAVYELATDSGGQTHHTVKALLAGADPLSEEPGQFIPYVRMTSMSESETPTILRASGRVSIVGAPTPEPEA
jgi:hypothetical protein